MTKKAEIGVIGMAVMGKNLALNIERNGHTVAIYNRTDARTKKVVEDHPDKNLVASYDLSDFVASIEQPRRIILMVQAGAGTDSVIDQLLPLLAQGDILIDGGNTFFEDTIRRSKKLDASGINFIGMGVSGGELGALNGPSMMPGGQKSAYDQLADIFEQMAAKADDGKPCVTYVGPNGAGHYVKMIHNGIEYGDMELIAETYNILRNLLGLSVEECAEVFKTWDQGELKSYLIEITADILTRKDDLGSGTPIVDLIVDEAANKGTGKWSSENALELGVPQSVITESVYARYISFLKSERVAASKQLSGPKVEPVSEDEKKELIDLLEKSLYFSKVMSYAQGFEQIKTASDHYDWNINYGDMAKIWRSGCIIRAEFLQNITDAFTRNPDLKNLLLDPYFKNIADQYQDSLRKVVSIAIKAGIPVPVLAAGITYYDSYRSAVLPANLIQAQRDYFGAHTYQRVDREGTFHYPWYPEQ
ncbi:NADP-dependent phosphogluconate dehydrogenase [Xylocopilactobacillus apicola]|uniref:6-phosphogluconate dehydrogenase, decarboxylating n=1 Tax=Xylocopilactobacillus apicola TaxID=2932184 RepID=A0AAU9DIS5_9LACO|nr:NADP-dependent phosphogluconate dehydrogenase [Xylocopilactobacillus apicola]BDR58321.1 6-phosphogluconate dehydrogenase, decarboxylating [Xylocopilactobacillus apicola]